MQFQVGDWVFCELQVQVIKAIKEGRITEVSDGSFSMGGWELRCFPMCLRGKQISDAFAYRYNELHKRLPGGWNFPDFHRHAVAEWEKCMENYDRFPEIYNAFSDWCNALILEANDLRHKEIGGVRILRQ